MEHIRRYVILSLQILGAHRSRSSSDMRMKDPKPQYTYLVEKIKEKYPDLAYIHLVEGQPDAVEDVSIDP